MSLTLISNARNGVFAKPIARAKRSPHVGGVSALVVDHTPAGGLASGIGVMPHPEILRLKKSIWNY
jgi:hypothetical protein